MQLADDSLRDVETNAGLLAREALHDWRQETGRDTLRDANAQATLGWIGKKCEFIDAVLELVEDHPTSRCESVAVDCRLDAAAAAVEQAKPKCVLQVSDRLRYSRLRDRKVCRGLCHAASF